MSSLSRQGIPIPLTCATLCFCINLPKYYLHPVASLFRKSAVIPTQMEKTVPVSSPVVQGLPQLCASVFCLREHPVTDRQICLLLHEHPYPFHPPSLHVSYWHHLDANFLQSLPPENLLPTRAFSMKPSQTPADPCPLLLNSVQAPHSLRTAFCYYLPPLVSGPVRPSGLYKHFSEGPCLVGAIPSWDWRDPNDSVGLYIWNQMGRNNRISQLPWNQIKSPEMSTEKK